MKSKRTHVEKTKLRSIGVIKVNDGVVKILEDMLENAKRGTVQAVMIGTINREGESSTIHSEMQLRDVSLLIHVLQARLLKRLKHE